jgi:hypothetical protein
MSPLNDDELSSLLEQLKSKTPQPGPEVAARALRAYETSVTRRGRWHRIFGYSVAVPLPVGVLAATILILIGVAAGRSLRLPAILVETRTVEVPVIREHLVYGDCSAGPREASPNTKSAPIVTLTFKEFQPVSQIKPRIVRSIGNEQ